MMMFLILLVIQWIFRFDVCVMKPEILTHPNVPKPLHGISPRTIMGKEWWDIERQKVYASTDYHCAACGVHKTQAKGPKWLEGHEYWDIDYKTGVCKIESIEPLCHYCHNFIHNGRLAMVMGKDKTKDEVIDILKHGLNILSKNKLKGFYGIELLCEKLGVDTLGVKFYVPKINPNLEWLDYKLVWNGKEYKSKFKSMTEWANHYGRRL